MTFATDIEEAAEGEPIEAIVIGEMGWEGYGDDDRHAPGLARKGEILRWAEARPLLDYEYDRGFGAPDCQAIRAWTEKGHLGDTVRRVHLCELGATKSAAAEP